MNEAETRAEHFDPALKAFSLVPFEDKGGSVGMEELERAKLTPLLRLKYHDSIADAVADLGKPNEIGDLFAGLQKHL